ncbi:phosphatase YCH1 KNAG_0G00780 [Huiozyma naganishii CBS 8797]|uniref:Rhodanese domain-containing protein n=1 Tax=Huiozyma naganishii (strain ATCC MYA-139 / BCRC 22969 / CBS 8797 / KCTC 17520 / NBRC 10181 / NCYC 3082 / Yp74L-3) TaxID=1071383 RepID=J7S7R8_HUIN7|nr:hypothetical protein KNAG_0G00780 [Kazachstania naganishii CBS 8797]CCK71134.1 hypothetical protein KNAG_0G00780 [Kazachstania naganishii CBS 8797]
MPSVADIEYVTAEQLYEWLQLGHTAGVPGVPGEPFAVVDVRGSDFVGGHIAGCIHAPSGSLKHGAGIAELIHTLEQVRSRGGGKRVNVVFHCAQSQQRGPTSALRFLRSLAPEQRTHYRVWVLQGGFNRWQDVYGEDSTVTEGYEPSLWQW